MLTKNPHVCGDFIYLFLFDFDEFLLLIVGFTPFFLVFDDDFVGFEWDLPFGLSPFFCALFVIFVLVLFIKMRCAFGFDKTFAAKADKVLASGF